MSKHAIDKEANADFWKKMRYGATAAVTVGSGLYAVTSVLNVTPETKWLLLRSPSAYGDGLEYIMPERWWRNPQV